MDYFTQISIIIPLHDNNLIQIRIGQKACAHASTSHAHEHASWRSDDACFYACGYARNAELFDTCRSYVKVGSEIILGGNTYHMLCTPGMEVIEKVGGMHQFMGWEQAMLTDSGGFQVLSLSKNGNDLYC